MHYIYSKSYKHRHQACHIPTMTAYLQHNLCCCGHKDTNVPFCVPEWEACIKRNLGRSIKLYIFKMIFTQNTVKEQRPRARRLTP